MNKAIYWFLICVMILNYIMYYILYPFVWLQEKIAIFNNKIDDKCFDYNSTKNMEKYLAKMPKKHGKNGIA